MNETFSCTNDGLTFPSVRDKGPTKNFKLSFDNRRYRSAAFHEIQTDSLRIPGITDTAKYKAVSTLPRMSPVWSNSANARRKILPLLCFKIPSVSGFLLVVCRCRGKSGGHQSVQRNNVQFYLSISTYLK